MKQPLIWLRKLQEYLEILFSLIPPDSVKPGNPLLTGIGPGIFLPGTLCKIFDLLAQEFF
jgi:hypothetical protein